MVDYYERPEFFDALLDTFSRHSIERVRVALEHDVRHFFLVYFYPSLSTGWSPTIIEEKFAPVIRRQTAMIHSCGGLVDYYDDGRLMGSADIFIRAGVDVLETCAPPPVGDFNLAEARKRWGRQVTFKGLVDMINVVWRGTPADIDRHVHDIITQNGGKQALILGTMDNIRPETSDENIAAYFNAANQYR
jgi:uroporphyrinogen decarboxylase